jgi:hypothetical protein
MEASSYVFTEERKLALEEKNACFQQLVEEFPTTMGKKVSKIARDEQVVHRSSLTYGELG